MGWNPHLQNKESKSISRDNAKEKQLSKRAHTLKPDWAFGGNFFTNTKQPELPLLSDINWMSS